MKTTVRVTVAAVFVLATIGASFAQGPPPGGRDPIGERMFPPELIMAHQNALGLDDDQKRAILSEIQSAQSRFSELQWTLHDAMETLGDLLDEEPADEARVMERLDEVLDAEREVKRTQLTLMIRVKNLLTAAQREQLMELKRNERERGDR